MNKACHGCVLFCLIMLARFVPAQPLADGEDHTPLSARVQEILDVCVTSPEKGELALISLGPAAVPYLCEALPTYPYPAPLLAGLKALVNESSVHPLLCTLHRLEGLGEDNWTHTYVTCELIRLLKNLGATEVIPSMLDLMRDETRCFSVRLSAAGTVARLASKAPTREEAERFIISTYGRLGEITSPSTDGEGPMCSISDMIDALQEVTTAEGEKLFREMFAEYVGLPHFGGLFVAGLTRQNTPEASALLSDAFSHGRYYWPQEMLQYAEGLVAMDDVCIAGLRKAFETQREAFVQSYGELGRQLCRQIDELLSEREAKETVKALSPD